MTDTVIVAEAAEENTGFRFSWGLAIAGGVIATAVTFFLLTLGAGFGLLLASPAHGMKSLPGFLTGGAIYFFAAQAFGFAVGGHVAGRLLGPVIETRAQEEFRSATHGLVAWAVAVLVTIAVVGLAGLTATSTGAGTAALYGSSRAAETHMASAYLVDTLFRPETGGHLSAPSGSAESRAARDEAQRILDAGFVRGEEIAPDDRARLADLVSVEAGMTPVEAYQRIDTLQSEIRAKTAKAADIARKAASYASLWLAVSLLFGALVAMVSAVFARIEDDKEQAAAIA